MSGLKLLKSLVSELHPYEGSYAICGGLAATIYRDKPRFTNDIDIAFSLGSIEESRVAANRTLERLGYIPTDGWISGAGDRLPQTLSLVVGRKSTDDLEGTIDFLLPVFPWLAGAVLRAQQNKIDFDNDKLPFLTPEDLIIAKAFALTIEPHRFSDMDDIQSIFAGKNSLDLVYLVKEFERLDIQIPVGISDLLPSALRRFRRL